MENVFASVASAVGRAKGIAQAFRQHGRHGSDTGDGAARGRRAAGKTAPFPPVRPAPPRLWVEPARADALGCGATSSPGGAPRALMGSPGSGESARDRNARRRSAPSRRPPIPGCGRCPQSCSPGFTTAPRRPRRARRCAPDSRGTPSRRDRRAEAVPDSTPLRELEQRREEGRERGDLGDDRKGPPRHDRHQRIFP